MGNSRKTESLIIAVLTDPEGGGLEDKSPVHQVITVIFIALLVELSTMLEV